MTAVKDNTGSRITESVREAVLAGKWAPNTKLKPATLAAEFGVSTTIIRETLTRLAGEGLLAVKPNRGFFIENLTLRELRDITELRCVSEAFAIKLSLERGDLQWEAELTAAHHRLARTPRRSEEDPAHINPEWAKAHRDFHQRIIAGCDCDPMMTLAANLATKTELYRQWAAPAKSAVARDVEKEHRDLLVAALARNAELTAELLTEHYNKTVQVVLEAGLVSEAQGVLV